MFSIREQLNNPGFNPVEFDGIRMQAGLNSFTLTPKRWGHNVVFNYGGFALIERQADARRLEGKRA